MGKSIQVKQPTLETKRISLLQIESDLLKKRKELQEKLLLGLSESQGDILKNEVHLHIFSFVYLVFVFTLYLHIGTEIVGNVERSEGKQLENRSITT